MLNAFRHHRNSHRGLARYQPKKSMCSTPFGIIGIHTHTAFWLRCRDHSCAQRLSASSEFTHEQGFEPVMCVVCAQRLSASSEFTRSQQPQDRAQAVSAQRLSASSEFTRPSPWRDTFCRVRAQRLSASSEFTLESRLGWNLFVRVLNAFRHHRNSHVTLTVEDINKDKCSTPFGIIGIHTRTWWH